MSAKPHRWVASTLGHGEAMCADCQITNREAAVMGCMEGPCDDLAPQGAPAEPDIMTKLGLDKDGARVLTIEQSLAMVDHDFLKMMATATTQAEVRHLNLARDITRLVAKFVDESYSEGGSYMDVMEGVGSACGMGAVPALGPSNDPDILQDLRKIVLRMGAPPPLAMRMSAVEAAGSIVMTAFSTEWTGQCRAIRSGENLHHVVKPERAP